MLTSANGHVQLDVLRPASCRWPWTDRMVKYIANSAAKNISSEDSQTIVPTLTMFGG